LVDFSNFIDELKDFHFSLTHESEISIILKILSFFKSIISKILPSFFESKKQIEFNEFKTQFENSINLLISNQFPPSLKAFLFSEEEMNNTDHSSCKQKLQALKYNLSETFNNLSIGEKQPTELVSLSTSIRKISQKNKKKFNFQFSIDKFFGIELGKHEIINYEKKLRTVQNNLSSAIQRFSLIHPIKNDLISLSNTLVNGPQQKYDLVSFPQSTLITFFGSETGGEKDKIRKYTEKFNKLQGNIIISLNKLSVKHSKDKDLISLSESLLHNISVGRKTRKNTLPPSSSFGSYHYSKKGEHGSFDYNEEFIKVQNNLSEALNKISMVAPKEKNLLSLSENILHYLSSEKQIILPLSQFETFFGPVSGTQPIKYYIENFKTIQSNLQKAAKSISSNQPKVQDLISLSHFISDESSSIFKTLIEIIHSILKVEVIPSSISGQVKLFQGNLSSLSNQIMSSLNLLDNTMNFPSTTIQQSSVLIQIIETLKHSLLRLEKSINGEQSTFLSIVQLTSKLAQNLDL
jgi:hypothetical protein